MPRSVAPIPMADRDPLDVTALLRRWQAGDAAALHEVIEAVHADLHRLAQRQMRRERAGHTLQTSALINEAYLRLLDQRRVTWSNREHFFAVSARIMRRILVDHARSRGYRKRGGGAVHVPLEPDVAVVGSEPSADLIALDAALTRLEAEDARKARVVELRYFGGLTVEEIAKVLEIAPATVARDWSFARAWLRRVMEHGA